MTDQEVLTIANMINGQILPGDYWYDNISGFWGYTGGPVIGGIYAGLPFKGSLQEDASAGDTEIFINGRELDQKEAFIFQTLNPIPVGRYSVNEQGFMSIEGEDQPFAHIPTLFAARYGTANTGTVTKVGSSYISSSGNCTFISGKTTGSNISYSVGSAGC